jgi:histidinol dehydrogenase
MAVIRIIPSSAAESLLKRRAARMTEAEAVVRPILDDVRKRGDAAVKDYARKFDGFEGSSLRVTPSLDGSSAEFRSAVRTAAANIRAYAKLQLPKPFSKQIAPGLKVGQVIRPIGTMAAYVPAGRYPLPSTLLMTVIPAQVAGVPNVCVTTPRPVPEIMACAAMLKVPHVFQIGGAHAIAAFAYGTKSVPKADRIVGPGNIYVAAAKKLLAGEVGIDFVAGPTEILIIAAEGSPKWIAADMLAQAEHDTDASAVLLTTSKALATAVEAELDWQMEYLPTAKTARAAIQRNSAIVIVESLAEAVELSNRFAPEHLSLHHPELLSGIVHAGGIFLGPMSTEAAGDYAAGPSHVLPTSGAARLRAGLSSADFVKTIATQQLSAAALRRLRPAITTLARAEGLEAHARSVEVRFEDGDGD